MVIEPGGGNRAVGYLTKASRIAQNVRQQTRETPDESPVTRPDDLGVRSWYNEQFAATVDSPSSSIGGICDRSSYPSSSSSSYPHREQHPQGKALSTFARTNASVAVSRDRESSIESNDFPGNRIPVPRKAYMDLSDAIALLDETCPNQEASPSLTPRTPRTPLTPFPRNKRVRSKSSDNSSNYSNDLDRLTEAGVKNSDKSHENNKPRRPFLRKIGVSKTEDRPLLAKIIAPKIIGKPYLEKIGPSRAVEKPFLEKIGSSKTLDRFTFDAVRELPRAIARGKRKPAEPSPLSIEPAISRPSKDPTEGHEEDADDEDDVLCIIKHEREEEEEDDGNGPDDASDKKEENDRASPPRAGETTRRRSNGKGYLLKMYSFETEDLAESAEVASMKAHRDPLRGASLDDVLDSGPSSFPPSEDSHEQPSSRSDERSTSVAELVKCRVTTSEEIVSARQGSPREVTSWGNSPRWTTSNKRRSRRMLSAPRTRGESATPRVPPSDESAPNSPSKRRVSPEADYPVVVSKTKSSCMPREQVGSPVKTRRQASNEEATSSDSRRELDSKSSRPSSEERCESRDESRVSFARCKSRRQTFREAMEKFGGTVEYSGTKRQVSEEILDMRNRKNGELPRYGEPEARLSRRGISSDNLKLSRETMVASVPSTSSLGYQSGDSSLVSQRSSYHSQDFIRGPLKILYDKFELQELPSESYAAFKMRTRANHQLHHPYHYKDSKGKGAPEPRDEKTGKSDVETSQTTNPGDSSESRNPSRPDSEDVPSKSSSITTKSVLRKQEGVDQQSDHETETGSATSRPKRRITNEPSQETMDLLTELRRVKSMLRTPSIETQDDYFKPPPRLPKKILLTDKEFCLSVERENSVRRRPSTREEDGEKFQESRVKCQEEIRQLSGASPEKIIQPRTGSRRQRAFGGPALFEKRCLSLDYADDEKPPKPEARAISLVAASRTPRSGTADYEPLDDLAGLGYDTRSYSSDVFTSPSDENDEPREKSPEEKRAGESPMKNHCAEVDIAIPVDHVGSISPKRRVHPQGRTSDFYEIISPRSTPFRVKKRLGRISVEDSVKQESFTLQSKVDCRAVVAQKRTKCFPL